MTHRELKVPKGFKANRVFNGKTPAFHLNSAAKALTVLPYLREQGAGETEIAVAGMALQICCLLANDFLLDPAVQAALASPHMRVFIWVKPESIIVSPFEAEPGAAGIIFVRIPIASHDHSVRGKIRAGRIIRSELIEHFKEIAASLAKDMPKILPVMGDEISSWLLELI